MADAGQKAGQGAMQGAAAGASFGPWGALIGGVAGGAMGYMQGDDPTAPNYVPGAPPMRPGAVSGQYGGSYTDPRTGSTQFTSNQFDPNQMGQQIQNQSLINMLMGQGNGAITNNLDFQAKSLQQQIQRLMDQQAGKGAIGKNDSFSIANPKFGKEWLNEDGTPMSPADVKNSPAMYEAFLKSTGGKYGGGGGSLAGALGNLGGLGSAVTKAAFLRDGAKNAGEAYNRWVTDNIKNNNYEGVYSDFQKTKNVNEGNSDNRQQALEALQNQLDYINKAKEQAGIGSDPNNPFMNFLNQRNHAPGSQGGSQDADKYLNPFSAKTASEADYYLDKSHQGLDPSMLMDASGIPDAKTLEDRMLAIYGPGGAGDVGGDIALNASGASGGTTMGPMGAYDGSKIGDFINSLNRNAEKSSMSNRNMQAEQNARRGLLGGSSEVSDLAASQSLADSRANNAAQGYGLDQTARNNWFNQKFAIDSHNSDVARIAAQARMTAAQAKMNAGLQKAGSLANIMQGGFSNSMAAQEFMNKLKQMNFNNTQSNQLQNYNEAQGMIGQNTTLNQNSLNNQRWDTTNNQNLDQQNFQDRMGLLGMITGQQQQQFNNGIAGAGVTNQQAGIGNQNNQWYGNNMNSYNASIAAGQNAQNMAGYQGQVNNQARNQNTMGQVAQGLGATDWGNWNPSQQVASPTPTPSAQGVPTGQDYFSGYNPTAQPQQPKY